MIKFPKHPDCSLMLMAQSETNTQ